MIRAAAKPIHEIPFDPKENLKGDNRNHRTTESRKKDKVSSVPMHWPDTTKLRHETLETWYSMAMQIISAAKGEDKASFRVMSVLWRFVNWKTGLIFPSNKTLADCAGGCSERTISRDVRKYEALGIIQCRDGWRKDYKGNDVSTRVIIMSLPRDKSASLRVPGNRVSDPSEETIRLDNSCPPDFGLPDNLSTAATGIRLDNSCPDRMDTSCLTTNEVTTEKAAARLKSCN